MFDSSQVENSDTKSGKGMWIKTDDELRRKAKSGVKHL